MNVSTVTAISGAISDLLLNIGLGLFLAFPIGYRAFISKRKNWLTYGGMFSAASVMLFGLGVTGFRTMPRLDFIYKFYVISVGAALLGFFTGILFFYSKKLFERKHDIAESAQKTSAYPSGLRRVLLVTMAAGLVVGFYFIASPYQNCMRKIGEPAWCIANTSW
jgi:uncharacterized membrane protein